MRDNFRRFDVTDPFGRSWDVEFRWLQNAISIRHADTVDCKYYIATEGEEQREVVIALPHAALVALAKAHGREVTDAWCMHLAGLHLDHMIATWEDMEKIIITLSPAELEKYNGVLESHASEVRRMAALTH